MSAILASLTLPLRTVFTELPPQGAILHPGGDLPRRREGGSPLGVVSDSRVERDTAQAARTRRAAGCRAWTAGVGVRWLVWFCWWCGWW